MKGEEMMDGMLRCEDVMQQLWDYLDRELTPERMGEVAAHLSVCTRCFPQYDFERAFLRVLRQVREESPAPAKLRERVLAALRDEGVPGV